MVLVLFAMLCLSSSATEPSADKPCGVRKPCHEHPALAGPCFQVRGRMNYWNGTPSVRIWQIGTKRILGVSEQRFFDEAYCNLPDHIGAKLSWDSDLFADFLVCPFTPDEPGVMRLVCVDSARDLVVRPQGKK